MSGTPRKSTIGITLAILMAIFVAGFVVANFGISRRSITVMLVAGMFIVALILVVVVRARSAAGRGKPIQITIEQSDTVELVELEDAEAGLRERFGHLPEMPRGSKISGARQGFVDGRRVMVFQSIYVISTPQATIPVTHTIYACEAIGWPVVRVTARNLFKRLLYAIGMGRGLMLDLPEFNRAFSVSTTDDEFAMLLLSQEMQAFMLEKPAARWRIGYEAACLVYRGNLKKDKIGASLDRFRRFWALVPNELIDWPGDL